MCGFSLSTFPTNYALSSDAIEVDGVICESGPGTDLIAMFESFFSAVVKPASPIGGWRSSSGTSALRDRR